MNVKKKSVQEVISRAIYKEVKNRKRIDMNFWLNMFAVASYNDACRDAAIAEITSLRDEFGMETEDIARFMVKRDKVIQAINKKEFTPEQAVEVLRKEEGLRITTDFEPIVRAVPTWEEVDKAKEAEKSEAE